MAAYGQPSSATDKAAALQDEYRASVERIKADTTLSDGGRTAKLATLYRDYSARMQPLQGEYETNTVGAVADLKRRLFAPPSTTPERMAGFRVALDRASTLSNGEMDTQRRELALGELLEQAEMTGDEDQAVAVFVVSAQSGAEEAISAFLADRPERAALWEQYTSQVSQATSIDALLEGASFTLEEPRVGGWPVTRYGQGA